MLNQTEVTVPSTSQQVVVSLKDCGERLRRGLKLSTEPSLEVCKQHVRCAYFCCVLRSCGVYSVNFHFCKSSLWCNTEVRHMIMAHHNQMQFTRKYHLICLSSFAVFVLEHRRKEGGRVRKRECQKIMITYIYTVRVTVVMTQSRLYYLCWATDGAAPLRPHVQTERFQRSLAGALPSQRIGASATERDVRDQPHSPA